MSFPDAPDARRLVFMSALNQTAYKRIDAANMLLIIIQQNRNYCKGFYQDFEKTGYI